MKDYSIYKFAIKQMIEEKPANKTPKLRKDLMEKLGITNVWLSRILNAKLESKIKLDHVQLVIISKVLKCSIDKLITKQCKKAIINPKKPNTVGAAA